MEYGKQISIFDLEGIGKEEEKRMREAVPGFSSEEDFGTYTGLERLVPRKRYDGIIPIKDYFTEEPLASIYAYRIRSIRITACVTLCFKCMQMRKRTKPIMLEYCHRYCPKICFGRKTNLWAGDKSGRVPEND